MLSDVKPVRTCRADDDNHASWWPMLLAAQPLPAFIAARDGSIVYANPAWQDLFGLTLATNHGLDWMQCLPPSERQGFLHAWQKSAVAGDDFSFSCTLLDKKRIFIRAVALPPGQYYSGVVQRTGSQSLGESVGIGQEAVAGFDALIDHLPVATAIYDEHGRFLYLNKAFSSQFGYGPVELPTLDAWWVLAFPDPDYRLAVQRVREHLMRNGQSWPDMELRVRCKNGSERIVNCQRVALRGRYKGLYLSSMTDLSTMREQQSQLAMREHRYRQLFDHAEIALWNEDCTALLEAFHRLRREGVDDLDAYLDKDPAHLTKLFDCFDTVDVNNKALELFGATSPGELQKGMRYLLLGSHADNARHVLRTIWQQKPFFRVELKLLSLKGEPLRVLLSLPVPQSISEAAIVPVSVLDLTVLSDLEDDLRLHGMILENMLEGVYLVRAATGRIIYANPAVTVMHGYLPDEMIGLALPQLDPVSSPGFARDEVLAALAASGCWHGELCHVRKDGSEFWVQANIASFEHARLGRLWVTSLEDISPRRLATQQLDAKSAELRAITRIQADFIEHHDAQSAFETVLGQLLLLSRSTSGAVSEVLYDHDGKPYLSAHLHDSASKVLKSDSLRPVCATFAWSSEGLAGLLQTALDKRELLIVDGPAPSDAANRHASATLTCLMILPVMRAGRMLGLVVLANRPGGYPAVLAEELEPVLLTFGQVIHVLRTREAFRQTRTALAQAEERWKFAIEVAGHGIWDWNLSTGEVDYSDTLSRILGFAHGELPTHEAEWRERIHPDDIGPFTSSLTAHLYGRTPYYHCEYRLQCKDGSYKWVSGRGMVLQRAQADGMVRIIGTMTDISAGKRTEEALKSNQIRLASMIEAAMDAIVTTDKDTRIIVFNPAAEQMFARQAHSVLGQSIDVLLPLNLVAGHQDKMRQFSACEGATRKMNYAGGSQVLALRADGTEFPVEVSISYSANYGEPIYTAMIRDITERKAAEDELRQFTARLEQRVVERTAEMEEARRQAEAANRAKTAFLATMSHEIRTPLNSVLGMAHLTLQTGLDDKQRDYLQKITLSGTHLLALINDVLDFSKIEAGKLELDIHDFDLDALLRELHELIGERLAQQGLYYRVNLGEGVGRQLSGDSLRLKQILLNLLGNAVKFTSHGGIELTIRLLQRAGDKSLLQFDVADSGIGMDSRTTAMLFQPFQQADSSTSRQYGGSGLGLAICYQLVQCMDGELSVASSPGQGSTFTFCLWLSDGKPIPANLDVALGVPDYRRSLAGSRVLLADDNPFNQQVGKELLEAVGIDVQIAANGEEAVRMASRQSFGLILMDMQMPGLDGVEATRLLRQQAAAATIPIIAMTANASMEDRQQCHNAGMNDFLVKPVQPERLYQALQHWLRSPAARPAPLADEVGRNAHAARYPIDSRVAKEMQGNDVARQQHYFDKFVQGFAVALPVMMALHEYESDTLIRECRRLQPLARAIGAVQLANSLEALEQHASFGGKFVGLLPQLEQQYHDCHRYLYERGYLDRRTDHSEAEDA